MEALRTQIRSREADLKDLIDWYTRIQDSYRTRTRELKGEIREKQRDYHALQKTRKEAHRFFNTALKDVRDRLAIYELGYNAHVGGLERLIEHFYFLADERGRALRDAGEAAGLDVL